MSFIGLYTSSSAKNRFMNFFGSVKGLNVGFEKRLENSRVEESRKNMAKKCYGLGMSFIGLYTSSLAKNRKIVIGFARPS
jgi:allophanate hydrolase subunit 1